MAVLSGVRPTGGIPAQSHMRRAADRRGRRGAQRKTTVFSSALLCVLCGNSFIACAPPGAATGAPPSPVATAPVTEGWRVSTREHIDLWLHGFAMLTSD